MNLPRLSLLLFPMLVCVSCRSTTPPPVAPRPPAPPIPQANQQQFEDKSGGISFKYPAGWTSSNPKETQFKFTLPNAKPGPVEMTLDVPKLPWHPPGWIPIDQVRSGYIDDAKKKMPDAQVTNLPDAVIPDAKDHRVKLTGTVDGKPAVNEAVLIVHSDKVYVLSIEPELAAYPSAQKALDLATQSLKWTQ
jgi:hypothetical protein